MSNGILVINGGSTSVKFAGYRHDGGDLDAEFVDCGGDQLWHAFGQSEMQLWFHCGVDADVKMEQMHVDRRGDHAGARIVTNCCAVRDRGPDR